MSLELNRLSVAEAARKIAADEITSQALTRACLDRVSAREGVVKAWSTIEFDHALAQARAADRAEKRGPLHGVPIGVKDVLDTCDLPTEMGSPIYKGWKPRNDAACVALLRAAGAIVLGKTVTCEFAFNAPGPTTNPHDPARTPGGSSQGSGAAVADFMAPAAFGTQTGGSVLRPASFCGVIGFKPTYNTFNREGLKFAAETFDTIGLITRTVGDAALLTDVLVNRAPTPLHAPARPPHIAMCRTHLWDEKASPETRACVEGAAERARAAGATVTEIVLPSDFSRMAAARDVVNNVERSRALAGEWARHRALLSASMVKSIGVGLATADDDYRAALRYFEGMRARLDAIFAGVDALIAPAVNGEAPVGLANTGDAAFQSIWTALHVPAITIPAGVGPNNMPVGVQLVAPRGADRKLLEIARWMQETAGVAAPKA